MNNRRTALAAGIAVLGVLSVGPATAYQRPGVRSQVDLTSTGHEPASGIVGTTAISGDGRYVAFDSDSSDLVPGDNNNAGDVFVRDTLTNKLELISRGTNGEPGVGASACTATICWGSPPRFLPSGIPNPDVGAWDPSISRDGRYVAFASTDVNLVTPARNVGMANVYVYDRRTARMTLASIASNGSQTDGGSLLPSLSANGRYVSFTSDATNLVAGDTNGIPDIFVRDLVAGKTTRVSVGTGNAQSCDGVSCTNSALGIIAARLANAYPQSSISGDGRYVEFSDVACNLVANDTNCQAGVPEVFVHDAKLGTTIRISVDPTGAQATYPPPDSTALVGANGYVGSTLAGANNPSTFAAGKTISDDGRYAVFASSAMNLVPNNPSWNPANPLLSGVGIYVRDLRLGRTFRVDVESDGQPAKLHASNGDFDSEVLYPSISADGRYVAMYCAYCTGAKPIANLMVYDRVTGAAQPIPCPAGAKRAGSPAIWNCDWAPQVSADGKHVSYTTYWTPTTSVPNFVGASDAFTWNRGAPAGTGGFSAAVSGSLLAATAVYRPSEHDLFVREQLRSLPSVAGKPLATGLVYTFDLTAAGRQYEIRADGLAFGLFRFDAGEWHQLSTLHGGFGTTGVEVVFAVPLADLGLRTGAGVSGLRAFTGLAAN